MSTIEQELERLELAKASLRANIEYQGVSVSSAATLSQYGSYVGSISTDEIEEALAAILNSLNQRITVLEQQITELTNN